MDDCDIGQQNALRRIIHPGEKCPENPLLIGEMPWEGNLICGGTVRKEDDEYRMWYQSYGRGTYTRISISMRRARMGFSGNGLRSDNIPILMGMSKIIFF